MSCRVYTPYRHIAKDIPIPTGPLSIHRFRLDIEGHEQQRLKIKKRPATGKRYLWDPSGPYKKRVKNLIKEIRPKEKMIFGALQVKLSFFVPKTEFQGWSTKTWIDDRQPQGRHQSRPKIWAMAKTITDAMSGVVYRDSMQIFDLKAVKAYSKTPYIRVEIKELF